LSQEARRVGSQKLLSGITVLFLAFASAATLYGCDRSEEAPQAQSEAPAEAELGVYDDPALPDPPPDPVLPRPYVPRSDEELAGQDDPRTDQLIDLGKEKDPQAVARVMALAFADPVLTAVQYEALSALEDLREVNRDEAVEGAGRILGSTESREVKLRAVEALEFLETRRATEILLGALDDPDPGVREAICDVVAYTAEGRDLEQVTKAYEAEADRQVKAALWEVLENIAVERKREAAEGASAS
jgi:HEAT repeat protein